MRLSHLIAGCAACIALMLPLWPVAGEWWGLPAWVVWAVGASLGSAGWVLWALNRLWPDETGDGDDR